MRTKTSKHGWTWQGKKISPKQLAKILGYETAFTLYAVFRATGFTRGEDIKTYLDLKGRKKNIIIELDGIKRSLHEVSLIIGVETEALRRRLSKYGPDCCLTYYPGRIPGRLHQRQEAARKRHGKRVSEGHEKADWGGLTDKPRTSNLYQIRPLGTWEQQQLSASKKAQKTKVSFS